MLPSFRFLFAAIMLSTSILAFGLGAAALLRTAHEEFASNPFWHAAPETTFTQSEDSRPVLAMLPIPCLCSLRHLTMRPRLRRRLNQRRPLR